MSSLRNSLPNRAHKERSQPQARKRYGILEKKKDYRERAKAFHKKQELIKTLVSKAANKNPDEFSLKMVNAKTVDGVHRSRNLDNQYTAEELLMMKTQDKGYLSLKIQSEKKKVERLQSCLHSLDSRPSQKHIYYAEDSEEAKEIRRRSSERTELPTSVDVPERLKRKTAASYRELEGRIARANALEKVYNDMTLKMELQKKGKKRRLREDEIVCETSRPVYKWKAERKR